MISLTRGCSYTSDSAGMLEVTVFLPKLLSRGRRYLSFRTSLASRAPRA